MKTNRITRRARLGSAVAALALGLAGIAVPMAAQAQPKAYTSGSYRPTTQVQLSTGEGQMINLPRSVANVWTSNPKVADVFVNTPRQINLFGKDAGEATIIATAADGSVVYGANVRVGGNLINPTAGVNVGTSGFNPYQFTFNAAGGPQEVRVAFDNDANGPNGDRNLIVRTVAVSCP